MTATAITKSASEKKESSVIFKDLSWLWRTAYNVAVQGCAEWDESEEALSELFDLSRAVRTPPYFSGNCRRFTAYAQFMEGYCKACITDIDPTVYSHIIFASFCSISCRVFAVRQLSENSDQVRMSIQLLACLIVGTPVRSTSTNLPRYPRFQRESQLHTQHRPHS